MISVAGVHLGRNARKQLRRGRAWTTADRAFGRVAEECRAGREPRWFTDALLASMTALYEQGWAHSIEVWQDGDLIGGALGVGVGRALSGDSMFGRRPEAARIAVADMAARLAQAGGVLIDAQWDSPFLRSLGAVLMPRDGYLAALGGAAERARFPASRFRHAGSSPPAGPAKLGRLALPAGIWLVGDGARRAVQSPFGTGRVAVGASWAESTVQVGAVGGPDGHDMLPCCPPAVSSHGLTGPTQWVYPALTFQFRIRPWRGRPI